MPIAVSPGVNKASVLLLLITTSLFGNVVEEGLKQVSLNERLQMKTFFNETIKNDQAAHVLYFMNKPVCLTGPVLKDRNKSHKDTLVLKGWLAFKKYEHLFPHPFYFFNESIFEPRDDFTA